MLRVYTAAAARGLRGRLKPPTVLAAAPLLWQVGVFVLAASFIAGAGVVVTPLTRSIPSA